jgi:hypothetical protein
VTGKLEKKKVFNRRNWSRLSTVLNILYNGCINIFINLFIHKYYKASEFGPQLWQNILFTLIYLVLIKSLSFKQLAPYPAVKELYGAFKVFVAPGFKKKM